MVDSLYEEVILIEQDAEKAKTPSEFDSILERSIKIMPKIGNPKLQLRCLETMQSIISKYISLRKF